MSNEITKMIVLVGNIVEHPDGKKTYQVELTPLDRQILGDVPHIQMSMEYESVNKYTDRYMVSGAAICNIADETTATLISVGLIRACSILQQGRPSFVEHGFSADTMAGITGLYDFTYECRSSPELRLVSTTRLGALEEDLASLGFTFNIPEEEIAEAIRPH